MKAPDELKAGFDALHPSDRRWLLARLEEAERRQLAQLFDRAGAVSSQSPRTAQTAAAGLHQRDRAKSEGISQDEQLLLGARADEVVPVISQLSVPCLALVFGQWRWPWASSAMVVLAPELRIALTEHSESASGAVSTKFAAWLLHELAEVVRQQRAARAEPAKRFETLMDVRAESR